MKRIGILILLALLLGVGLLLGFRSRPLAPAGRLETIARGPLAVWSIYEGKLESRTVRTIMSSRGGAAAIIELVSEGSAVTQGEVLVRFDASRTERELVKLEMDLRLARSEQETLLNATIPLQLMELETQIAEARANFETEQQYLADSRELARENLISAQELKQQEAKVQQVRSKLTQLEEQLKLTQQYSHPMAVEGARARLASAEQAYNLATQEVAQCTVYAPAAGLVSYLPVHVGGEFRTARVGDSIYRNQPFLLIPDMSNLVVHCYVPESEMARVGPGARAWITPLAYPDIRLDGRVESVGAMAQTLLDKPNWMKYFHVLVALRETDPRLRSGMSVTAGILAGENADAVLVPRRAVEWNEGRARVRVWERGRVDAREIRVGLGDEYHFEVLGGLAPGDQVLVE